MPQLKQNPRASSESQRIAPIRKKHEQTQNCRELPIRKRRESSELQRITPIHKKHEQAQNPQNRRGFAPISGLKFIKNIDMNNTSVFLSNQTCLSV